MKEELISWGNALEEFNIESDELVRRCNDGLKVFDSEGNRIYATSQCEAISVEAALVSWGRIHFDRNQDELIFDEEFIENELFRIQFFPETGDFVIIRKDASLGLYEQIVFAHCCNLDFPYVLSEDLFKSIHKAGDVSYLPSDTLEKTKYLPLCPMGLEIKENNFILQLDVTINSSLKDSDKIETDAEIIDFNDKENKIYTIPYELCQRRSGASKKCEIAFQLSTDNKIDFNCTGNEPQSVPSEISCTILLDEGERLEFTKQKDIFKKVHKKAIVSSNQNLKYLQVHINEERYILPRIDFLAKAYSWFSCLDDADENEFYKKYSLLGMLSYFTSEFILPEETNSSQRCYEFSPIYSPLLENSIFLSQSECNRIKTEFFFDKANLIKEGISQKEICLHTNLLKNLKEQQEKASGKDAFNLKILICKLESKKTSVEVYDIFFPDDTEKSVNAKGVKINRSIKYVENYCDDIGFVIPSSKVEWKKYYENPSDYIKASILAKGDKREITY